MRKKKWQEWGEQILALDKEDSFLQMQNQMKETLPKNDSKNGGIVYMKERTQRRIRC